MATAPAKEKPAIEKQLEDLVERKENLLPQLILLAEMARQGRTVNLPLANRSIPIVVDTWAKPELGSGCVKITPAHDPNDYDVAIRCRLPMINILRPDGTLMRTVEPMLVWTMPKARNKIVADLEAGEFLDQVEQREIELAHSDRSKTPIEPFLADQWFVKMDTLAQSAMDAVTDGHVEILPGSLCQGLSRLAW